MEMDDAAVAVCPQVSGNDGYLPLPEIHGVLSLIKVHFGVRYSV